MASLNSDFLYILCCKAELTRVFARQCRDCSQSMLYLVQESTCRVAEEASSVKTACQKSCQAACSDGLDAYEASAATFSGFRPKSNILLQARKKCIRNCGYQCQKEGTGYIFTINSLS